MRPFDRRRLAGIGVALLLAPLVLHLGTLLLPNAGSYVVLSGSMEPAVAAGSLVYVVETGDYEPGDVLTYEHEGRTITHRLVGETETGFVTKGDANDERDPYRVSRAQVHGEVIASVPVYGRFLQTVVAHRFLAVAGIGALMALQGAVLLLRGGPGPEAEGGPESATEAE